MTRLLSAAAAAAMVFCVSCGNQLLGHYCHQCGSEDSQSTADAQSQVPVLTIPEGDAKKHVKKGKSRKDGKFAARDAAASKSNGSVAWGIDIVRREARVY